MGLDAETLAKGQSPSVLGFRAGAYLIDTLAVMIPLMAVFGSESPVLRPAFYAVELVYLSTANGLFGVTLGKAMFGLRVVGADGRPPGLYAGALRTIVLIVDTLVGAFIAYGTPGQRRLGDLAAKTWVLKIRARRRAPSTTISGSARRVAPSIGGATTARISPR